MSAPSSAPAELGLERWAGIDLDSLDAALQLRRRFESKFVVDLERLPKALGALGSDLRVLEVAGRRSTAYTNIYFDTAGLRSYSDHLKGRRRRFKVRTRRYGEAAGWLLELKCKGRLGETIKHRWSHPGAAPDVLGQAAEALLRSALDEEYGFALPHGLAPVLTTRFERVTLVDLAAAERITIDLGLGITAGQRRIDFGAGHAVLETKSPRPGGVAAAALVSSGLRADAVSKYCIGIAGLHGDVRGNPWLPVLRRMRAVGL